MSNGIYESRGQTQYFCNICDGFFKNPDHGSNHGTPLEGLPKTQTELREGVTKKWNPKSDHPTTLERSRTAFKTVDEIYQKDLESENPWNVTISNVPNLPVEPKFTLTLPTNSAARKDIPIVSGCIKYFPAALAGVARISKAGNDKHNPGQPLHHARGKSTDHMDCIVRHLIDVTDLLAANSRGNLSNSDSILLEVSQLCWRALALSQEIHENLGKAPLAPGAKENA